MEVITTSAIFLRLSGLVLSVCISRPLTNQPNTICGVKGTDAAGFVCYKVNNFTWSWLYCLYSKSFRLPSVFCFGHFEMLRRTRVRETK